MRTLFFKIFLGFWLALASLLVIVIVLEGARRSLTQGETTRPEWIALHASHALAALERGGVEELARHSAHVQGLTKARTLFLDASGRELTGSRLEPEVAEIVQRVAESGRAERQNLNFGSLSVYPVTNENGDRFTYVRILPYRRLPRFTLPSATAGWPLALAGILTAGVVCFGLARHLTAPIRELEAATRRLAEGDLSVRVGHAIQKRHDEIADLGRHFNRMAERLEAYVGAQRELLRNVSHELRSPLARLTVGLGLARQTTYAASVHLDRIELEAERLNELIGRLLALTRLEAGDMGDRTETVELASLLRSVVDDANYEAGGDDPKVSLCCAADQHSVQGVPEVLRSALDNVVRNAVQHSPEGATVRVSIANWDDDHDSSCVVRVCDQGPGVPTEEIEKVFRPFHRVDEARDRSRGGAGLGLAIAQRAVQLHGGRIEARNDPHGGLVVDLVLPSTAKSESVARSAARETVA